MRNEQLQICNAYLELLDHLERAEVRYAVLHGWQSVTEDTVSDLDLIVCQEDLARAESVLNERYRILNVFQYESSSFGFVASPLDPENRCTLLIDISTDYRCRGRIFFTARELLESRQRWSGVWVVAPHKEFEYLLIKKFYEKGAIPIHQRTRIARLAKLLGPEKARAVMVWYFGSRSGQQLFYWIHNNEWDQINAHIPLLQRSLSRNVLKRNPFRSLRYWPDELRRIRTRWHYPTGLAVTVVVDHCDANTKTITDALRSVPSAFRRVVVLEPVQDGANSIGGSFGERIGRMFRSVTLRVRLRALIARSTLVIRNVKNFNRFMTEKRSAEEVQYQAVAQSNIVFTAGGQNAPPRTSMLCAILHRSSEEEHVFALDLRLPAQKLAQCVRESLEGYLCRRYAAYRQVRFSNCSQGHQ